MTTIVLAAGLSERMGRNKLLLPYKGEAIIVKTVRNALSFSDKVIVVTGNERERVEESLSSFPLTFVYNENYRMGQRTSTIEGIKCVENDDFSILPGDLPLLGKEDASGSCCTSSLPENSSTTPPLPSCSMKASCFSAVPSVRGWNQWV